MNIEKVVVFLDCKNIVSSRVFLEIHITARRGCPCLGYIKAQREFK